MGRIEDLARRTTKEIRHMLFTLRPLVLESQGLVAALQSMAEKTKETFSQNVLIKVDENILESIEMGKQGVIFYIVEEAVNNARKHAQAGHIWVNLRLMEQGLALLEIQDDGIGFDVAAVNRSYDQRGSLGMVNLRDRTELVNGVLDVQSVPGQGHSGPGLYSADGRGCRPSSPFPRKTITPQFNANCCWYPLLPA